MAEQHHFDLLVIGGGINGCGVARDAAGRGLRVGLVEQADLAAYTSSASTKLVHGGLRYLEYLEFGLVRAALAERARMLAIAPHLVRPQKFVLPHAEGLRPRWQLRLGLFLYDHLGQRGRLPPSRGIDLWRELQDCPLQRRFLYGYTYADCCVDDSRLVVLNAVDAASRGAQVLLRTRLKRAEADRDGWRVECLDLGSNRLFWLRARALVNAAGCWINPVSRAIGFRGEHPVRLVQGSHIVVERLFEGDEAYLLQNADRRVVFAIPFEDRFTLIGTTDVPFRGELEAARITPPEIDYLCKTVNHYFTRSIRATDVRWAYTGVRALQDDQASDVSQVTRDYELVLEIAPSGSAALTVIGGKITTYRQLAESALALLHPYVGGPRRSWTADVPLPGGDLPGADLTAYLQQSRQRWPFVPAAVLARWARAYGTRTERILGAARSMAELGEDFGGGLTAAEVDYLRENEWARSAEDVLWRRSKLGLHDVGDGVARLQRFLRGSRSDCRVGAQT